MGKKEPKQTSDSRSSKKHTPHPTTEASSSTSSTPCGSKVDIAGGEERKRHPIDEVITGEEIHALRVKEEDLTKLFSPNPPVERRLEGTATRSVLVRKKLLKQTTGGDEHKASAKRVAVLKPLPHGSGTMAVHTLGAPPAGPRVDHAGTFIPHSLLGEVEDFTDELQNSVSEATFNKTVNQLSVLPTVFRDPPPVERIPQPSFHERHAIDYESNALSHWSHCMADRRRQQEHLADTIQSSPSKLTMNHGNAFRETQEERTLLDRAMPSLDYGKGFRVGSEFYSQQVQLGDEQTGIRTTLTLTERGKALELELVRVPDAVQREKGLEPGTERNVPAHYTWKESPYLAERRRHLRAILEEKASHPLDCSELQVIGQPLGGPADNHAPGSWRGSLDSLEDSLSSDTEEEEGGEPSALLADDPLASQPDVSFPHTGPALSINGDILQWEGPPKVSRSRTAHPLLPREYFVSFKAHPNEIVRSHLDLSNVGTTAIYFSWQHLPRANAVQTVLSGNTQRFYFDTRGGVMLPGERVEFEFMFKAEKAGVFSERWSFQTGPVLCGGRPVIVSLTGISYTEDLLAHRRSEITDKLMHEVAVTTAHKLINQIVDGICSPPRTPSPEVVSCLEEDVFTQRNPGLYYNFDAIAKLKSVYMEVMDPALEEEEETRPLEPTPKSGKKEGERGKKDKLVADGKKAVEAAPPKDHEPVEGVPEWDLSLDTLQELVLGIEDDTWREAKLVKMNDAVGLLSLPPASQLRPNLAVHVRQLLNTLMDDIDQSSTGIRLRLGLPPKPFSKGKEAEEEAQQSQDTPISPAQSGKKKGSKETGKAKGTGLGRKTSVSNVKDEKAKGGGTATRKKSRQSNTPSPATQVKDQEMAQIGEGGVGQPVPPVTAIDQAAAETRYKELFYVRVHHLISSMVAVVGGGGDTEATAL